MKTFNIPRISYPSNMCGVDLSSFFPLKDFLLDLQGWLIGKKTRWSI